MKLTRTQLKGIIREELQKLNEDSNPQKPFMSASTAIKIAEKHAGSAKNQRNLAMRALHTAQMELMRGYHLTAIRQAILSLEFSVGVKHPDYIKVKKAYDGLFN